MEADIDTPYSKNITTGNTVWTATSANNPIKINPTARGYITISVSLPDGFYLSEKSDCASATVVDALESLAKRVLARLEVTE